MNYGEAKKQLLSLHEGSNEDDYRKEKIAQNVVILSIAENHERIANSLSKICDLLEDKRG